MNKVLKIGGIVLGVFVVLIVIAVFLNASKSMLSTSSSYNKSSGISAMSTGLPGQSASFSSPMGAGLMKSVEIMSDSYNESSAPSPSSYSSETLAQTEDLTVTDKKIIKNGNLTLTIENADEAAEKISEIAKGNSGEIFSSNFYQSGSNVKSGTMTVKVPVANFERAFTEIKTVASLVVRESTSGQDVTEQYIDLQAQLKNRQAEEQSFVKILDQAQKIQDVLDVTREISRVRGTIEQLQGRMRYLESQTDMSTISVNLTEDANITVVDSWRPLQIVKESFNVLIKKLQGFVEFLIQLIIIILPILIAWAILIWIVYIIGKKIYLRIKNRKQVS